MAKSKKLPRALELTKLGREPAANSVVTDVLSAYNHFNYFYNRQDAIKFLASYLKKTNPTILRTKNIEGITTTVGWIARMLENGVVLPKEVVEKFNDILKVLPPKLIVVENIAPVGELVSVEETKFNKVMAELEAVLDSGEVGELLFLREARLTKDELSDVISFYNRRLFEIEKIGKVEEIDEAYSCFTKKEIKKQVENLEKVIRLASLLRNPEKLKAEEEKVRVIKSESGKFSLLKKDDETGMKSLPVADMFGKKTAVFYAPSIATLFVFNSEAGTVLGMENSSVINVDREKSFSQKVRKPKEVLKNFRAKNIDALKVALNGLTTVRSDYTRVKTNKVRIGSDVMILLSVY